MHLQPEPIVRRVAPSAIAASDWRERLPVLIGPTVSLRQLSTTDAPALLALLGTEEVSRFISPPPTSVDGFARFIAWTRREQAAGRYVCYGVVPHEGDAAVGLFQVRGFEPGFAVSEWGFALGSAFWGTGMFLEAAQLVLGFTFGTLGTFRLEARAAIQNGRGQGALRKLGAVQEGVLRQSFLCRGDYVDQTLSVILADEWVQGRHLRGDGVERRRPIGAAGTARRPADGLRPLSVGPDTRQAQSPDRAGRPGLLDGISFPSRADRQRRS